MKWIKKFKEKVQTNKEKIKKYTFVTCATVVIGYICFIAIIPLMGFIIEEREDIFTVETKSVDIEETLNVLQDALRIDAKDIQDREYNKLMDLMHMMANTKIVAQDGKVWGKIPINKLSIYECREIIKQNNFDDEKYLLKVLYQWERGNYSHAVGQHNYFWHELDGEVGFAVNLRH